MIDLKTNSKINLKSFLDQEVLFFADPEWQKEEWQGGYGELYAARIVRFNCAWNTVWDHRQYLSIGDHRLTLIKELKTMLLHSHKIVGFPEKPKEYFLLLNHPEWKKIQRYAKDVYNKIAPMLK